MYKFTIADINKHRHIAVKFPYADLAEFKTTVRPEDQRWLGGPGKHWTLTLAGFADLAAAHSDKFAPVSPEVMELATPVIVDAPSKIRIAKGVDA
jgi:hypothetical protein